MDPGTIIGILGTLLAIGAAIVAVGRWVGRRDSGEENISKENREAREETRVAVKRIELTTTALQSDTRAGFDRLDERLRPLFDWHATRAQTERSLSMLELDTKDMRERLVRLEESTRALANQRMRPPRSRKTGVGS